MKRTLTLTLTILAVIGLVSYASAQPTDWPAGPQGRQGRNYLSPEAPQPADPPQAPMGPGGMDRPGWQRGPDMRFGGPGFMGGPGFPGGPGRGFDRPGGPRGGPGAWGIGGNMDRPGPEMRPFWRNDKVRKEAKITKEQVKKLDENYNKTQSKLIDQRAEVAHKQLDLEQVTQAEKPELKAIENGIEKLGQARIEVGKTLAAYRYEVHEILKPEQLEKLKAFREKMEQGRQGVRPRLQPMRQRMQATRGERRGEMRQGRRDRMDRRGNDKDRKPPEEGSFLFGLFGDHDRG